METIALNSVVVYTHPMADEIGLTFTVIEIDTNTNWCKIMANVDMRIKPTEVANITDLKIAE